MLIHNSALPRPYLPGAEPGRLDWRLDFCLRFFYVSRTWYSGYNLEWSAMQKCLGGGGWNGRGWGVCEISAHQEKQKKTRHIAVPTSPRTKLLTIHYSTQHVFHRYCVGRRIYGGFWRFPDLPSTPEHFLWYFWWHVEFGNTFSLFWNPFCYLENLPIDVLCILLVGGITYISLYVHSRHDPTVNVSPGDLSLDNPDSGRVGLTQAWPCSMINHWPQRSPAFLKPSVLTICDTFPGFTM